MAKRCKHNKAKRPGGKDSLLSEFCFCDPENWYARFTTGCCLFFVLLLAGVITLLVKAFT